jgi:hypothetical protein
MRSLRLNSPSLLAAIALAAGAGAVAVATSAAASSTDATVPHYDHIALIVEENHGFADVIGNPNAPNLNRLANTYGLATQYFGTSDPSAPNYVAMLGGSDFGIADDNPFYTHEVHAPSLMDQLDAAHLTWKGYFQGMPYPGFAQYCYPVRCNGSPDSDPVYSSKHNGIAYFASVQSSPAKLAQMTPDTELATDLATGRLPNFAYIVPDQCHDMHGSPPWCEDSGDPGDVNDNRLVADADTYLSDTVDEITRSAQWSHGRNAIVITFDEGDDSAGCCGVPGAGQVATVVITNNGPRHLADPTPYSHYSLLATMEKAFGLGCLQLACDPANGAIMAPLFGGTPASTTAQAATVRSAVRNAARPASASGPAPSGWTQVQSPDIGSQDNSLGAISAASGHDIWAVGNYLPDNNPTIVQTLAVHFDGQSWQDVKTPDVGTGLNTLFGVHALPGGTAWAVGEALGPDFLPRTLVEHFDGHRWRVSPSPTPGGNGVLYGVTASSDRDVWAVGTFRDGSGAMHSLAEHFDGVHWSVARTPDPGSNGNLFYAVAGTSATDVWAVGQRIGTHSPDQTLVEHFDGASWSTVEGPETQGLTLVPFGLSLTNGLQLAGSREPDARTAAPWAAIQVGGDWRDQPAATVGTDDNFFYSTDGDWSVGTTIDATTQENLSLIEQRVGGHWETVASPNPGADNGGSTILGGVAVVGPQEAWVVGTFDGPDARQTLILHHTS